MLTLTGACHCGKIQFSAELSRPLSSYAPRACDCDFCQKHAATYLSDPSGQLRIHLDSDGAPHTYRQGSETAEFLVCRNCGVLTAVLFHDSARIYAAINTKAVDGHPTLGTPTPVSPKALSASEKVQRWKENWFCDVALGPKPTQPTR